MQSIYGPGQSGSQNADRTPPSTIISPEKAVSIESSGTSITARSSTPEASTPSAYLTWNHTSYEDSQGKLPSGWEIRKDIFGKTYYFNGRRRVSTRTRPALDTFTCFSRLPIELRLKIWEQVNANEPRCFLMKWIYGKTFRGVLYEGHYQLTETKNSRRIIYLINRESRMEAQRMNPPLVFGISAGPPVPFNSAVDTVVFATCTCRHHILWPTYATEMSVEVNQMRKIRNIAIPLATDTSTQVWNDYKSDIMKAFKTLPNLEEISFCKGDMLSDYYPFTNYAGIANYSAGHYQIVPREAVGRFVSSFSRALKRYEEILKRCLEDGTWKVLPRVRVVIPLPKVNHPEVELTAWEQELFGGVCYENGN